VKIIGHFQVILCLCFKTSPSVKPFIWKWVWFAWKWTCRGTCFPMNGFPRRLVWHRDQRQLRNGLLLCLLYATRAWWVVQSRKAISRISINVKFRFEEHQLLVKYSLIFNTYTYKIVKYGHCQTVNNTLVLKNVLKLEKMKLCSIF